MNIAQLFLDAAAKFPENIAIREEKSAITYRELHREVLETAAYFHKKGIRNGDRVLVFVPMSIDLYRTVLALFYLGATAVFLDEWVNKQRMELCCQIADCKGFIAGTKVRLMALFSKELRAIDIKLSLNGRAKNELPISNLSEDDSALITFTTGSTSTPKAADRSHGFLKEQFDALLDEIDPKSTDIDMPVLPIVLFVNLGVGSTSLISPVSVSKLKDSDVPKIFKQLDEHRVNRITASPFFIRLLAENMVEKKLKLAAIEKIFTGGAPVFPTEASLYVKAFPNAQLKIVYGSTEAEPISSIAAQNLANRADELSHGLPVGEVYHKTQLRIIKITNDALPELDEQAFTEMQLAGGEVGEIVVAGPHVLKRYFNNSEAFKANKIKVNDTIWHRTGDSGFMRNNELFLTGRCKQLIATKSGWLYPFIIENQLQNIDGITMGTLLQTTELVLCVESNLSEIALKPKLQHLSFERLAILPRIPRDPRHQSKIDYDRLREMI